jgi:UDP-N-acetylglucosamine 2-epimerase (non-hydrolysing)
MKYKIALIGGARPNFMKIAPLYRKFKDNEVNFIVISTGQHFDANMAGNFLDEFSIKINYNLKPNRVSTVSQIADIMVQLERIFVKDEVSLVIVFGDVNSTLAASIVANKLNIKLAHVEAGLRSRNYDMPEENNRIVTDQLSDYLLASSDDAVDNLKEENLKGVVSLVGNIMIDNLVYFLPQIKDTSEDFYFCTLHRAENVDNKKVFVEILDALEIISKDVKIYLPLHPRTKIMTKKFDLLHRFKNIFSLLEPLSYKQSLYYQKNAKLVLTDSGGIQEETTILGVPCLTMRAETERPITVTDGTNIIGGTSKDSILRAYKKINYNNIASNIPLWDGKTAQRILNILDIK